MKLVISCQRDHAKATSGRLYKQQISIKSISQVRYKLIHCVHPLRCGGADGSWPPAPPGLCVKFLSNDGVSERHRGQLGPYGRSGVASLWGGCTFFFRKVLVLLTGPLQPEAVMSSFLRDSLDLMP